MTALKERNWPAIRTSYSGHWLFLVPEIMRLHAEGRKAPTIAMWLASYRSFDADAHLSPETVRYIIARTDFAVTPAASHSLREREQGSMTPYGRGEQ